MSRARTGQIYVKYMPVKRIWQENPNFVTITQVGVYRTFDTKAQVDFSVAREIRTPQKHSARMKWYQAVTTAEKV
jgi:hypothetical protein